MNKPKIRKPLQTSGLITIALIIFLIVIQIASSLPDFSTPLERFDLSAYDMAISMRGTQVPLAPIVIVAIDDASFNYTGYQWPWPRKYLAKIIDYLNRSQARVIGLDVFLFESDPDPEGEKALLQALQNARSAVSIMHISRSKNSETLNLPLEPYQTTLDGIGITGIIYDDDAMVRSVQMYDYAAFNSIYYYSWAINIAQQYLAVDLPTSVSPDSMTFNGFAFPLKNRNMLVNYIGPPNTFPYYSAHQVALEDFSPETFKDKIVLIGATSVTMQDVYPTPYSANRRTPGVEVIANTINTLITGNYINSASPLINILLILIAAIATWLIRNKSQPITALIWMVAVMAIYLVAWVILLVYARWQIALSAPEIMLFLGMIVPTMEQVVKQELEKRRVRALFSRFISPEMVNQLLDTQDIDSLNKRAVLTILFSDIRNFTSISEKLSPEEVVKLLNPYLEAMTRVIHDHDGTVDKYEGDAILAFFGEPIPHPDHAIRALQTAYEMRRELSRLRWQWHEEGIYKGDFDIGIGINTGEVFVGLVGSEQRVNYTVIGDAVNLASRLQDQTKEIGWPIVISRETYEQVKDDFIVEFADSRKLKGKSEPVEIFKVIGPKSPSDEIK